MNDTPAPHLLSAEEIAEADELLVDVAFDSAADQARAAATLAAWAGAANAPARRHYIASQQAAERQIDLHVAQLRHRYPRRLDRPQASAAILTRPRPRWGLAAGGLAATMLATVCYVNPVVSRQELHTTTGELSAAVLNDGSRVLLNTGTTMMFESRLRSREVTLVAGEALFTVADHRRRPFLVVADTARIRDIGTVFSVRRDRLDVTVAVLEGEVEISAPAAAAPRRVLARQAAAYYGGPTPRIGPVPHFDALVSWKDRRLEFSAEPLGSLIEELRRYRHAPIVFADAAAERIRVTGGFSSADPNMLLRTLPMVAPVVVEFSQDGTATIASK